MTAILRGGVWGASLRGPVVGFTVNEGGGPANATAWLDRRRRVLFVYIMFFGRRWSKHWGLPRGQGINLRGRDDE